MDEGVARTIAAQTHGRYLVRPPAAPGPAALLVGFHGYAQSAEQHMDDLRRLPGAPAHWLVAVQALHLFYTRADAVVGSWMTRLEREHAIADNTAYVAQVVAGVRAEFAVTAPLVYAGFSQGASMAYRAAALAGHACAGVIALGGDLPPDLCEDDVARLPRVLIGRGLDDAWFGDRTLQRDAERLRRAGVSVQVATFEGGHEWSAAFEAEAGAFVCELARAARAAEESRSF